MTKLRGLRRDFVQDTLNWIDSGVELFRQEKPATPPKHLVSYFLLADFTQKKVLLVDHIKAGLWLPKGGHVDPGEHPTTTVGREAKEELDIEANFYLETPLFISINSTVGRTAGHLDVNLWYLLKGKTDMPLAPDPGEFHQIRWFSFDEIPFEQADPSLRRFLKKVPFELNP